MKTAFAEQSIATPDGVFRARYSERGLVGLRFPIGNRREPARAGGLRRPVEPKPTPQILRWHKTTATALKKALSGRGAKPLPPLDWTGTTKFQQSVWRAMLKLGPGRTMSYGEIAGAIGRPKAVRAVGGACGANPVPVLVPCHRILAANKKIGGFSGGLDWKRKLLEREGIRF